MGDRPSSGFSTRAVHAFDGHATAPPLGPLGEQPHVAPVYLTSNYQYPSADAADAAARGEAYLYGRVGNPSVAAFEEAVAALEGGEAAVAFGSGMAALSATLMSLGPPGEPGEVLASQGLYGGTHALLRDFGPRLGLQARFVPAWDTEAVAAAISERTRALVVETVSNPLLRVADLPALAALARQRGVPLVVDSTFAPPCLVKPIEHGASLVVHSVSKYLAGHGDVIAGVVTGAAADIARVRALRTSTGGIMDPFSAFLASRGLRTLSLRMERQCETAARVALQLARHPRVRGVHYPGLTTHPDHQRAIRLLALPGAMVSFELADLAAARRFYDRVRVIARAASLGDLASLLTHPASFSHRDLPPAERAAAGIADGLLRLSLGIEDAADLEWDIEQALADD